jgi:tetratricopeptide (TPR) repeat protein
MMPLPRPITFFCTLILLASFSTFSIAKQEGFKERLNQAYQLSNKGKTEEALAMLDELKKTASNDKHLSSVISQRASTLERVFRLREALEAYERLRDHASDTDKLKYYSNRAERKISTLSGKVAQLEGKLQESLEQEALELSASEKVAVRAERSQILMGLGQYEDALNMARAGISDYKKRGVKPPKAWHMNAITSWIAQQKYKEAILQAEALYEDYPTSTNKGLIGVFKIRAEDYDGAWEILDELFTSEKMIDDLSLSGFYALAIKKEEYGKAVEIYEKADSLGLTSSSIFVKKYPRASLLKAMSKSEQHQKLVDFVKKRDSKYGPSAQETLYLAKAHNSQGQYKKAEKMIKKNLRILATVHHSELNTDLAVSYLGKGKLKKALKIAKRAVSQDSENQEARAILAKIESTMNQSDK